MKKKIIIPVFLVILVAAVIYIIAGSSSGAADNGIKLIKAERGDVVEKALALGQIEPKDEIAVKSKISGIVDRIFVEVGDVIVEGTPLLEIKPDPTPLEYAEARRNMEMARVELENAETDYNRMSTLLHDKLISQKDYDSSENLYKQLKLRLNMAQERLALIEKGRISIADREIDSIIKSPASGMVLERRVHEGDPVVPLTSYQAGTELIILADMESLIFKGTVDEIDVGKLSEGMEAELKIGAIPNERIIGRLSKISPKARRQENATLFDVEISIVERGEKVIRAGYSANAELVINKSEKTLFIPERLVTFADNRTFVEIQDSEGLISQKDVRTGLSDGINIEILEGLAEGDEIVERPPKEIK
jgi:HlyD family secretion protein